MGCRGGSRWGSVPAPVLLPAIGETDTRLSLPWTVRSPVAPAPQSLSAPQSPSLSRAGRSRWARGRQPGLTPRPGTRSLGGQALRRTGVSAGTLARPRARCLRKREVCVWVGSRRGAAPTTFLRSAGGRQLRWPLWMFAVVGRTGGSEAFIHIFLNVGKSWYHDRVASFMLHVLVPCCRNLGRSFPYQHIQT